MKAALYFFVLLLSTFANAQNYKLIEELRAVATKDRAIAIGNEMIAATPTKYRLYVTKESINAGIFRLRYIPAELTDADMTNGNFTEKQRSTFITIDFSFYNAGEDINAVRPAVITYKLNEITANYLDLFPIWKKYYKPDANFEKTITDFKMQHLKETDKKIDVYIFQTETGWALRNM
ncbi:hypothetical protein [Flavobacterium sp. 3HN19-14]|uniref:hypothetical protein n=1 Tax=Flavobacterium sp. 3HN19-14 TaxID=3448133 RepID=UPI003EE39BC8